MLTMTTLLWSLLLGCLMYRLGYQRGRADTEPTCTAEALGKLRRLRMP